jgi:hypothetical protein
MPSGKKLTHAQANAKIRSETSGVLRPGMARLSICDRKTGEVSVIEFGDLDRYPDLRPDPFGIDWDDVGYALDRELAELENTSGLWK